MIIIKELTEFTKLITNGIKSPFRYIYRLWLNYVNRGVIQEGNELFYWYKANYLDIRHLMSRDSIIADLSAMLSRKDKNFKSLKICIRNIHYTFRRDYEDLYKENAYFHDTLTKKWIWRK